MNKYIENKNFVNNQNYIVGSYFKEEMRCLDDLNNEYISINILMLMFIGYVFIYFIYLIIVYPSYLLLIIYFIIFLILLQNKKKIISLSLYLRFDRVNILLKIPKLNKENIIVIPKK